MELRCVAEAGPGCRSIVVAAHQFASVQTLAESDERLEREKRVVARGVSERLNARPTRRRLALNESISSPVVLVVGASSKWRQNSRHGGASLGSMGLDATDSARAPRLWPALVGNVRELDGLRGIAILLVVLHYFWPPEGPLVRLAHVAHLGWIGVDLFFVISGF